MDTQIGLVAWVMIALLAVCALVLVGLVVTLPGMLRMFRALRQTNSDAPPQPGAHRARA